MRFFQNGGSLKAHVEATTKNSYFSVSSLSARAGDDQVVRYESLPLMPTLMAARKNGHIRNTGKAELRHVKHRLAERTRYSRAANTGASDRPTNLPILPNLPILWMREKTSSGGSGWSAKDLRRLLLLRLADAPGARRKKRRKNLPSEHLLLNACG